LLKKNLSALVLNARDGSEVASMVEAGMKVVGVYSEHHDKFPGGAVPDTKAEIDALFAKALEENKEPLTQKDTVQQSEVHGPAEGGGEEDQPPHDQGPWDDELGGLGLELDKEIDRDGLGGLAGGLTGQILTCTPTEGLGEADVRPRGDLKASLMEAEQLSGKGDGIMADEGERQKMTERVEEKKPEEENEAVGEGIGERRGKPKQLYRAWQIRLRRRLQLRGQWARGGEKERQQVGKMWKTLRLQKLVG
jgi:hypothetical protein